jgi:hypothetical protein
MIEIANTVISAFLPNPLLKEILVLRRSTYLASTVDDMEALLKRQIGYAERDANGNFIYQVGANSQIGFMCHYDTVEVGSGFNKLRINPLTKTIKVAGGGIWGADCGAGVYLMIRMIQAKIPGCYGFFAEEEQGRFGSMACRIRAGAFTNCLMAVSFDRKGYSDVITHQMDQECCSSAFATALAKGLNQHIKGYSDYSPNPNGGYTDSYCFRDCIPECANISIGYFNEHRSNEYLDYGFLEKLLNALCQLEWKALPIERVLPKRFKNSDRGFSSGYAMPLEACSIKNALVESIDKFESIYSESEFPNIDDATALFELGEVVSIDGSNRFARDVAISYVRHLVFQYDISVFIYNFKPLFTTTLNLLSHVSNIQLFSVRLADEDWQKLALSCNALAEKNIRFFEIGDCNLDNVLFEFRSLCEESDAGKLFLIDANELFNAQNHSKTKFLSQLNYLAKEFHCSFIIII